MCVEPTDDVPIRVNLLLYKIKSQMHGNFSYGCCFFSVNWPYDYIYCIDFFLNKVLQAKILVKPQLGGRGFHGHGQCLLALFCSCVWFLYFLLFKKNRIYYSSRKCELAPILYIAPFCLVVLTINRKRWCKKRPCQENNECRRSVSKSY